MSETRKIPPAFITIIVIGLIAVSTVGVLALSKDSEDTQNTTSSQDPAPSESAEAETTEHGHGEHDGHYHDGDYTAVGNYTNPGGGESIEVTLTLKDGKITAINSSGSATSGNSKQYQGQFLAGYKTEVVGKNIDEVSLSRVAGSSLTSEGFNAALEAIKADARS